MRSPRSRIQPLQRCQETTVCVGLAAAGGDWTLGGPELSGWQHKGRLIKLGMTCDCLRLRFVRFQCAAEHRAIPPGPWEVFYPFLCLPHCALASGSFIYLT